MIRVMINHVVLLTLIQKNVYVTNLDHIGKASLKWDIILEILLIITIFIIRILILVNVGGFTI